MKNGGRIISVAAHRNFGNKRCNSDVPLSLSLSLSLSLRFLSLVVIQAQMDSADLYMMSLYNFTII